MNRFLNRAATVTGAYFRAAVWLPAAMACLLIALVTGPAVSAGTPTATAIQLEGDKSVTQFTALLTEDVGYTATVLPDPYRVIVDLAGVSFDLPPGAGRKPRGLVKAVRYGVIEEGKSRIVIDTAGPVLITKSTLVPRAGKKPARITIELTSISQDVFDAAFAIDADRKTRIAKTPDNAPGKTPSRTEEQVATVESASTPAAPTPEAEAGDIVGSVTPAAEVAAAAPPVPIKPRLKPVPGAAAPPAVAAKPARADGKKVIVIDPGHGGVDPGALSPSKTLEKDVVLAFAKDLKTLMDANGRHEVVLTRNDDRFISLKDRVGIARKHGADLFIAVHADTLRGQTVTGTTIYTLSEKASDAESEELARRENHADAIAGINLSGQSEDVAGILIDLAQRDSRNQAAMFSRNTLAYFKNVTKMTGKPIRSAGFTVLKAPDVPSILIELGFLSNPKDEERLKSQAWRKSLAQALSDSIDSYFGATVAMNR